MPESTNTITTAKAVPGDIPPDLLQLSDLFGALTPNERAQVWNFLVSLLRERSA